jgi:hypothetical protein
MSADERGDEIDGGAAGEMPIEPVAQVQSDDARNGVVSPDGPRWRSRFAAGTSKVATFAERSLPSRDAATSRWGPFSVVGLAILFNLIVLRTERLPVAYPNDSSVHLQTVKFATDQWSSGHFPLDGWYPYLSLGSPYFLHYQSFSAVLAGLLGLVIGPAQTLSWTLFLLLSVFPLSVYIGSRLFDLDRWTAACAAALAPLAMNTVGYGFEHEAYMFYGSGLWSQLWAMVVLPVALGLAWRAVSRNQHVFLAIVAMASVIAFHFLTAYLAGLCLVLFAFLRPREIWRRLVRVAWIGVTALLLVAWIVVPLLATAKWASSNEFQVGTYFDDSYGARQVLSWLFHGTVFDAPLGIGRFPVFSILVAVGFVVCILRFRKDERARAIVAIFLLSLVLYCGRPTFGFILNLLPLNSNLLFHRYIMGVQLLGMLLGGIGATTLGRLVVRLVGPHIPKVSKENEHLRARILLPALTVLALVIALYPAWHEVASYDHYSALSLQSQLVADATQGSEVNSLIAIAQSDGGGRIYAGEPNNWGYTFTVGTVPVYIYLTDQKVDEVGFTLRTSSLMSDPEVYFDETQPGDYTLFGIHWLILPAGHKPPVPATLVDQAGAYELYAVANTGLIHVVDTSTTLTANGSDLGSATEAYLNSSSPTQGIFATVAYDGQPAALPTVAPGETVSGSPGTVDFEHDNLAQGEATALVTAKRLSVVLLSASFDPGWTVTVDGKPAQTEMIAPALIGVTVGPGTHTVIFLYQSYSWYPELFLLSFATFVGLLVYYWRRDWSKGRGVHAAGASS